jgi:transglutaminase-like putative cysteine protease
MQFRLRCELQYDIATPTTVILNVEAQRGGRQRILGEAFTVEPQVQSEEYEVPETGNRYRRMLLQPGTYSVWYTAEIESTPTTRSIVSIPQVPIIELPFDVMNHLYPSRYCQSDKLARFAWREFGEIGDGYEKVTAICNWIYENVDYLEGSSDSSTSAYDTFTLRAGVCRDFAHLGITFARALGIPARFVSAYALDLVPQDFHAVFEAYLGGQWYLFDATRLCPLEGILKIAVGRDAADSAFLTFFGQLSGPPKLIRVERLNNSQTTQWTTEPVSLSAN